MKCASFFPIFFLLLQPAFADKLSLSNERSRVEINVTSNILSGSGNFESYDGSLTVNQKKEPESLELQGDMGKFSSETLPIQGQLLLSNMLRSLSSSRILFRSDSIIKSGSGFLAKGTATAGSRREQVSIPFKVAFSQPDEMVLTGSYSKTGSLGGQKMNAFQLGTVTCDSEFKLVFLKN